MRTSNDELLTLLFGRGERGKFCKCLDGQPNVFLSLETIDGQDDRDIPDEKQMLKQSEKEKRKKTYFALK